MPDLTPTKDGIFALHPGASGAESALDSPSTALRNLYLPNRRFAGMTSLK